MDKNGKLVVNTRQKLIVVRIYQEFLDGKTPDYIKRIFEKEKIKNWDGEQRGELLKLLVCFITKNTKGMRYFRKAIP